MQEWFRGLEEWRDFYVFAGTAAATLMGLMFVVMSLGQRILATEEGTRATRGFFTPIVVFFATVIVLSLLMLMPQTEGAALGVLLAILALAGFLYMIGSGAYKAWRTNELGIDDLFWYVVLPYVSYLIIGVSAAAIWKSSQIGLYSAAAAILLLLLIGIRNAWDLVVYNIQRGSD
jgi:hypothetical protein